MADYDQSGLVDQRDLDAVLLNWGSELIDPAGIGWTNDLPSGPVDQEELDKVTVRQQVPMNLKRIRIVAVNVVKLNTDNIDPRRYFGRIEAWQKRVVAAGASEWRVINDLERLDAIFSRS